MSFDLSTIKDLVAEGYGLNAQASAFLMSQLEQVTVELDAAVENHRKHAARLITEKVVVMEERDMLLDALKDCHARLNLLCKSGRSKMLDSKAEGKAAGEAFTRFQLKDLRAKAGTDIARQYGIEAARLALGHTTQKQTQDYIRSVKNAAINAMARG